LNTGASSAATVALASGRRTAAEVDPCHRDITTGGPSLHHLQPLQIRVGCETGRHVVGVWPDDRDLRDVAAERQETLLV
jgi:hypothetical protein